MDFSPGAAIGAGVIGGTAMVIFLYMGIAIMPRQMRMNLLLMLGTMMLPAGAMAYLAGAMMHAAASIVFGLIHGAVFAGADIDSATGAWGLLFGAAHWVTTGMALGMIKVMHPRIRDGTMEDPGPFALRMGPMTAGKMSM